MKQRVQPWHTADGDYDGEVALDRHLFDEEANPHPDVLAHSELPPHQHAFVRPRPWPLEKAAPWYVRRRWWRR